MAKQFREYFGFPPAADQIAADNFQQQVEALPEDLRKEIPITKRDIEGSTGTEIYAGYLAEEYLDDLTGSEKASRYDEMRRSESQVKMVLSAVQNPIKQAEWFFKPGDDTTSQKYMAEFCEHVFFNDLDKPWMDKLHEILSMTVHGYSLFEATHKVVIGHKRFGDYIGLEELGWRSQRTIEKWNLENNKLVSVEQQVAGDLKRNNVVMDARFLYLFTLDQEGNNYEGISMLRSCYGAYMRKKHFLRLLAVGIEKYAVPTPIGKVPEGKYQGAEYDRFCSVLQAYTSHQKQWVTLPAGWDIAFNDTKFNPDQTRNAINEENKEIVKAFLANFLELGIGSTSGSYSLSFDLSDFFLGGIEHIAKTVCSVFNRQIIPDIIKANFGEQEVYPQLDYSGISDRIGTEYASMLKTLVDGGIITPDDKLEEELRKRIGLPEFTGEGVRKPAPAGPAFAERHRHREIPNAGRKLFASTARTPRALIRDAIDEIEPTMKAELRKLGKSYIEELIYQRNKRTDASAPNAVKASSMTGINKYTEALIEIMASVAEKAWTQAGLEIPKSNRIELSEKMGGMKFALTSLERLPKIVQTAIRARAGLLAESQAADVEKATSFQFISSVTTTDSTKILQKDLDDALEKYVESSSVVAAAGNTASSVVNETRKSYFFDPGVLEGVQGFEFVNGDPVSEICQDLAGSQFAADDPEAQRYFPPLHHNCKSYLVPILLEEKFNPTGLKPSDPKLEDDITL